MRLKLKEILNTISEENKEGLTELDNWKITDYDFMTDMGFKPDGEYHFSLKNPHIKVSHKKGVGFVMEDFSKTNRHQMEGPTVYDHPQKEEKEPHTHVFQKFGDLSEFFTKYEQAWEHEPYKS
jgi:hypothetical protein